MPSLFLSSLLSGPSPGNPAGSAERWWGAPTAEGRELPLPPKTLQSQSRGRVASVVWQSGVTVWKNETGIANTKEIMREEQPGEVICV